MFRRLARLMVGLDVGDPDLDAVKKGVLARLAAAETRLDVLAKQQEQTRADVPEVLKLERRLGGMDTSAKELARDVAHHLDRIDAAIRELRGRQTGGARRNLVDPAALEAQQAVEAARSGDPALLHRLLGIADEQRDPEPV